MRKKLTSLLVVFCVLFGTWSVFSVFASEGEYNLAEGCSYSVKTGEPITYSYALYERDGIVYNKGNGCLTDGKISSVNSEEGWYRAYKGKTQRVTIDLGKVCAVSQIDCGFLHNNEERIFIPRYINILLSTDGLVYGTATEYLTNFDLSNISKLRCDFSIMLQGSYAARYVTVEFNCDEFVFSDEIKVIGTKELFGGEKQVKPDFEVEPSGFLRSVGDLKNIVKVYSGASPLTEDYFLPLVGYCGSDKAINGKMFDSMAILPSAEFSDMQSMQGFLNSLFGDNGNLSTLDSTVKRVYSEIGLYQRFPVLIGVPYPNVSSTPFGDIDDDGEDEFSQNLQERIDIVKWFVNEAISAFNSKQFQSIYLAGFYWTADSVDHSRSEYETEFFQSASNYIKNKWLLSVADFSYLSAGFSEWEGLRFSGAVMRPNAAFAVSDGKFYFNPLMFEEFTETCFNNHLGIGIETDVPNSYTGDNYFEAGRNYERYLYYGYRKEYSNALKAFSQGVDSSVFNIFCNSDITTPKGQYLRRLYDLTYSFINGLYKNEAPTVSVSDLRMVSGDSRITAEINIEDADSYRGDLKIEFPQKPQNGIVAVSSDKETLIYRADEGFVGHDSFTIRVSDGFNYSEEISVNVTVEPKVFSESSAAEETSVSDDSEEGKPNLTIWIAVAALILTFLIVIAIIKKEKKR